MKCQFAILIALSGYAVAEVRCPACFSDHMVLQQGMPVPVWGTAAPSEKITVAFREQRKSTVAGRDGKWLMKLDPLKCGTPEKLAVNGIIFSDVLVGEVWVGSGQSNMQFGTRALLSDTTLVEATKGTYPQLRLLYGKSGHWMEPTPQELQAFSAQLFYFGMTLQKELHVPVGVILGAVSGTPSGQWLGADMFSADPACVAAAAKADAAFTPEVARMRYEAALAKWPQDVEKARQAHKKEPGKPGMPLSPAEGRRRALGRLYSAFIQPVVPYAIRGVLWDQGEAGTSLEGVDQCTLMGALITGWRKAWGQGDFPFLYVQKPSGGGCAWDYHNPVTRNADHFTPLPAAVPGGGEAVEMHINIMRYPNTAMATTSDLGHGIHPANKSGYATRDAMVALTTVYGRKTECYGPIYKTHTVEGDKVRVKFDHVGQGLAFRNGDKLQGFALAGADRAFHWADARIDGDSVVLSSADVKLPVAVRYAWSGNRTWANLFNKDGLPALTFRTDKWSAKDSSTTPEGDKPEE